MSKDNSKVSCSQSKIEFKDIICKMEVEMEGTYGLPSVFWTQNSSNEKFCTESVPDFEMATDSDESNMPPPLPYYDRKIQHDQLKSLGRAKSCCEFRAKEFLVSKRLQQSMPNIQTPRSQHNRRIGATQEFRAHEHEKLRLPSRIREFEALLADL